MPGMDRLGALARQLREFFVALPPAKRISFLAITALVLVGTFATALWVQMPRYRVLFAKLDESDAGSVIEYLKEEKIPYRVAESGSAIEVPSEHVYEVRMALAARGVPQGGGVGYELFDQQTLGMTDFVQRLGYQRALQGELARTIGELSAVERARVHLALPERSLFVAEERPPTASVVLRLRAGRSLTDEQVQGVVHLVAASVEGLDPANVTVVDTAGRVLTHPTRKAGEEPAAQVLHDQQRQIEEDLVDRIETMLERVLGPGHAVARVTAQLDLSRIEETQEIFDPDRTAIRNERRSTETSVDAPGASGVPGVTATLTNEGDPPGTGEASDGPRSEREDATLSYEISKTTSHRIAAMGGIEKLSVAVLIDGVSAGEQGGEFVPRPEEELDRYEELIKRAVGFDQQRGDEIEVVSAPFQVLAPEEIGEPTIWERVGDQSEALWRAAGLALVLVLGLAVVRPFLLAMVNRAPLPHAPARAEVAVEEQELELPAPRQVNAGLLEIARQNPEQTAMVIKQWVAGGS